MSVTVEGVETRDQFERLNSLGVNFAQGYLMGRPVPIDELEYQPHIYRPRRMVPLVAARSAFGYVAFDRAILACLV
ncbi:EAL domain-containing protein [Bradyrhizobium sp. 170]|nr:EAL domain-containing protein [Bradyrhizobium sp. 170]